MRHTPPFHPAGRKPLSVPDLLLIGALAAVFLALTWPSPHVRADTNISATTTDHWAWSDSIGWIDFYNTNSVNVSVSQVTGYATSSAGNLYLSGSGYGVTNDGSGGLSGWGWNDTFGWISFDCHNNDGCGTSSYHVNIDSQGDFQDYAWNDAIGWISFNCGNPPVSLCGSSNFKVNTSWVATSTSGTLESSTFDTGSSGGAQINSVVWHGALPSPTASAYVGFQLAISNSSSGPWTYKGYDGTSNTWYVANPGVPMAVDYSLHNNARYFRYKVNLTSNLSQTASPRVDDVEINWSP